MTTRDDCGTPGNGPGDAGREPARAQGSSAPGDPGNLAGHIVGCDPCGESLDSMQAQGNALKYLTADGEGGNVASNVVVVERVLAESARAGREKLADLLYELAKALFLITPEAANRNQQLDPPRSPDVVSAQVQQLASRGGFKAVGKYTFALPQVPAVPEQAIKASESCLTILMNVEGQTVRQQFGMIQVMYLREEFGAAADACRKLTSASESADTRSMAQANLACMLNRQGDFEKAAEVGEIAFEHSPEEFMVGFNYAVSLAYLGNAAAFKEVARRLASHVGQPVDSWKTALVSRDCEVLSTRLSCSASEMRSWFGLDAFNSVKTKT